MPRFTAEASLYKWSEGYRLLKALDQTEGTIYPQVGPEPGVDKECFRNCYQNCLPDCIKTCLTHGG
jgi:hypothetical protein